MKSTRKSADETTRVVFRRYPDGQIIALFPDIPWNGLRGEVTSYMHLGQHGAANYNRVVATTRPVRGNEYRDLLAELARVGYKNLNIVKRINIQHHDR